MKKAEVKTNDVKVNIKDYLKMIPTMDMLEEIKSRDKTRALIYEEVKSGNENSAFIYEEIKKDGVSTYMKYIVKGEEEQNA